MRPQNCLLICLAFALLPLAGAGPVTEESESATAATAASEPCPPGSKRTLTQVQGLLRSDHRADARARLGVTGVNYHGLRLLRSPEDNAAC